MRYRVEVGQGNTIDKEWRKMSEPIDFPTDIVHDGIDYYLDGSIDDGPWDSEMGMYYTDDAEAPDQVLHLTLTDALRKWREEYMRTVEE